MDDLIRQYYTELNDFILITSALFAVYYYRKFKNSKVRIFIFYMVYVAMVDVIGSYTAYIFKYESLHFIKDALKGTLIERNYWWFTIFWNIGSALFLSVYFYKILTIPIFKRIVKTVGIVFFIFSISYLFLDIKALFNSQIRAINIFGGLVIINCIIYYFIELLTSDKILNFIHSFHSIVSSALFIWWLIITPLIFYDVYFSNADWSFVFLRHSIYFFANFFMYSMFMFALVWGQPESD